MENNSKITDLYTNYLGHLNQTIYTIRDYLMGYKNQTYLQETHIKYEGTERLNIKG